MMIDFWLAAVLLALVALSILLWPLRHARVRRVPVLRQSLNVAAYEERVAELEQSHRQGLLDAAGLAQGKAEAARELLDSDEQAEVSSAVSSPGRRWPLLLVCALVPIAGLALYAAWGSSDQLRLTRAFSQPPASPQEMTQRLEQAASFQPDSAQAWYFLGRSYMNEARHAEAAKAFERAVQLAGAEPELLGQWAQALYFAAGKQLTEPVRTLTTQALAADPREVTSLGLLGIAAYEEQRYADAVHFWERLVALLPERDPSRQAIIGGIENARSRIDPAQANTQVTLELRVELATELAGKVRAEDTVFVFASAANGPPMPVAARRLSVAQLPATLLLSDADAMLPGATLSNAGSLRVSARISRSGNPLQGEWQAESLPVEPGVRQTLLIDRPAD